MDVVTRLCLVAAVNAFAATNVREMGLNNEGCDPDQFAFTEMLSCGPAGSWPSPVAIWYYLAGRELL
jgi:hypothetical protein